MASMQANGTSPAPHQLKSRHCQHATSIGRNHRDVSYQSPRSLPEDHRPSEQVSLALWFRGFLCLVWAKADPGEEAIFDSGALKAPSLFALLGIGSSPLAILESASSVK